MSLPETLKEEEEEEAKTGSDNVHLLRSHINGTSDRDGELHEEGDDEADDAQWQMRRDSASSQLEPMDQDAEGVATTAGAATATHQSNRAPAAGAGTRVRPRPVPRSSASLRHISSRGRTVSFGAPLPEDRAAGQVGEGSGTSFSSLQKRFQAVQRKNEEQLQRELAMESDAEEESVEDDERDLYVERHPSGRRSQPARSLKLRSDNAAHDLTTSSDDDQNERTLAAISLDAIDDPHDPFNAEHKQHRARSGDVANARHSHRRTADAGDSPPMLGASQGLLTPGSFPLGLHTPLETPPELDLEDQIDPRQRLEWHTMLQSVLRSEVLKSETKRITSADAPSLTKQELMYHRWLDIRASLRGRGHQADAVETESKRLSEGWPVLIERVLSAIKECREDAAEEEGTRQVERFIPFSEDSHKINVLEEVSTLLNLVDNTEEQFPSRRKMSEIAPQYFAEDVQQKLAALYSWYNMTSSLQLQFRILQEWTGSKTLDVQSINKEPEEGTEDHLDGATATAEKLEDGTFLERLLKENSLQSTFENRTLKALHQLISKARSAITQHHKAFKDLHLPPFEPELVQLINFPTRLMEAALRARLDYVGKLTNPSVLIVDSLIDDLRGAIALACRIKVQYTEMVVPDSANGWDLPPCIGESYDAVLREALRYFFKLLNYKLKASLFFKETEILEPEWRFLSTAVEVIERADILVARSITKIVNKLFVRIVQYFERELSAPSTRKVAGESNAAGRLINPMGGVHGVGQRGPSVAGGLTKGQVKMTLDEKARWIHQVFDSVRIRNRKLLGFARDIRNRLENAAEYDLNSLRSPAEDRQIDSGNTTEATSQDHSSAAKSTRMDLTQFLQTLIDADFFLVLTGSFEQEGMYLIAEPSLHDRPELVQDLFCKCLRRDRLHDEGAAIWAADVKPTADKGTPGNDSGKDEEAELGYLRRGSTSSFDTKPPRYLLALSPRDAFMWTGKVMSLQMDRVDVDLKDRRLRLIADGPQHRLESCKQHLYKIFGATHARAAALGDENESDESSLDRGKAGKNASEGCFPLSILDDSLAHMSAVQSELLQINKGVYMLTNAVLRAVPKIRQNLRLRRRERSLRGQTTRTTHREYNQEGQLKGGDCDELIQNCFSKASEQGLRALPFIESARLRGQTMLSLARLAIDWVAFICDDCEPTDRKTFKFAVAALEMAMFVTRSEGILNISEDDFVMMRSKVASCVGLLISHFDILGARDSAAKAKAEEERLDRERADRKRALEMTAAAGDSDFHAEAVRAVQGAICGAPPMLNRLDSGMQDTEQRWVQKVMEWDAARQAIDTEQRLIGRVLDDTRLEDRGLQFLASSTSRIQIRWQQGRFIGGGTFGTVYLGVNLDSGGLMAVKEIRLQDIASTPTMYKQIKDEMSVMEMLSHPNIVEYYGIEVHRDKVYIFEEYCQGGSLAQLLEHGRIEDEMVSQVYTLQMLDGLVYLHSKNVVHRDIKPDNILLDHMGVIKFVDFGAAKVLAKNSRTIQRSRRTAAAGPGAMGGLVGPDGKPGAAASLQGTPMYMSPEVIKGESRGRRGAMDVWSLGCVVLECATGRRPWSQLDNEWAIMFHIGMAQQHPPLPEAGQLSELGIDFIRQCLIIDPYERPSAAEMREHPWIKNLVEELNAANEDELNNNNLPAETPGVESMSSALGSSFVHGNDSAAGVAAMAATPGTRTVNGFQFGRSGIPSFNSAVSSFSRGSSESSTGAGATPWRSQQHPGAASFSTNTTVSGRGSMRVPESTSETPNTFPAAKSFATKTLQEAGHPNHDHPGSEALIADLAYAQEDAQKKHMMSPSETGDVGDL